MPSVEELLNSPIELQSISHLDEGQAIDTIDSYLEINPNTREIIIPDEEKVLGVMSDDDGERKYFRIDRYAGNNLDFSKANIYVNYRDAGGNTNQYLCDDVKIKNDAVVFSWLLSRSALTYKGTVYFIVCCKWSNSDGILTNEWNTTLASGEVLEGLEATAVVKAKHSDIIEQLLNLFAENVDTDITYNKTQRVVTLKKNDDANVNKLLPALTSDATAKASDIYKGKTAYIKGDLVTGTFDDTGDVIVSRSNMKYTIKDVVVPNVGTVKKPFVDVLGIVRAKNNRFVLETDASKAYILGIPANDFGDAEAKNVDAGYTFTSKSGLKIAGTSNKINTDDGTISAGDVRNGKKAYSRGSLVRGNLSVNDPLIYQGTQALKTVIENSMKYVQLTQGIRVDNSKGETIISGSSQTIKVNITASKFGSAKVADVAKGKTFTSADGYNITGTATSIGGIDTSDADAVASDIAKNKTAYVNGVKITGTMLKTASGSERSFIADTCTSYAGDLKLTKQMSSDEAFAVGAKLTMYAQLSDLGDAVASDVVSGKTFTSREGVKVKGTYVPPSTAGIKHGKVTRSSGGDLVIDTGLDSINVFMMHKNGSHNNSVTGYEAIYYNGSSWYGIGISKASYLTSPLTSTPSATISGGTVTISENIYSEEYEWFAM